MLKSVQALALSSACIASTALADVPRTQPDQALQQLARQLEPFKSVSYALSQGYVRGSACETHPTLGAMGHHYVHPGLLGLTAPVGGRVNGTGTYTGVNPPAILLYAPDGQGGLKLVGIELLVFAAAWNAEHKQPPKYRGREYNYMADNPATPQDEAHNFMPHYDLHIWLYEHNPSGLYAQWNPALSCSTAGTFHAREVGHWRPRDRAASWSRADLIVRRPGPGGFRPRGSLALPPPQQHRMQARQVRLPDLVQTWCPISPHSASCARPSTGFDR